MSAIKLDHQVNYLYDFVKQSNKRYFIAGDREFLYLYNRDLNPLTGDPANSLTKLNVVPFTGGDNDRWQSAITGDALYLVNIATAPQVFIDNTIAIAPLVGDASMPQGARYVINSVNHLIMAYTVEGGTTYPGRVRWSDINNPSTWIPNQITAPFNEAGFIDLPDEIRGIANIGPSQFVVFTTKDTYLFTYYGLPVIWNIQNKILADIGIFQMYSLVEKENDLYFLGFEGFYQLTNSMTPQRIGLDSGGISRVDIFIINALQLNFPYLMFSFNHPVFPEVCFVFQSRKDNDFQHMLTYNWEKGTWASRMKIQDSDVGFPFTAASEFLQSSTRTLAEVMTPGSQTLTWQQKAGSGALVLITGDSQGNLFIHDGLEIDADGEPINRRLRTADLTLGDRAKNTRLSRIFWDLQDVDYSFRPVNSTVFTKTHANDVFALVNTVILDNDSRHDLRAVDKLFQFGIDTTNVPSLSHIAVQAMPAGGRA